MALIVWSEMMRVGIDEIDADHKTLVGLINNLHRAIGDEEEYATLGSVLKALEDYAADHFEREERMMAAVRYTGLATHAAAHVKLTQQVRDLKERYDLDQSTVRARDCLLFLQKWLVEHICTTDMDYRSWVVGHHAVPAAVSGGLMTGAAPGKPASLDWKALRVLVVDDNQNFCQVMRTILEGVGVQEIRIATDLKGGRNVLETTETDILVTDWHVGPESGLDLVSWVRSHPRLGGLPILLLSGHERIANRDVALSAGADEFMEKPISARGLLICIARLMARKGG